MLRVAEHTRIVVEGLVERCQPGFYDVQIVAVRCILVANDTENNLVALFCRFTAMLGDAVMLR